MLQKLHRDANLWRLSILHYTPPPWNDHSPTTPHPSHKSTRLRTLYEVLHEVHVINIRFHHLNDKIIFVSEHAKMSQRLYNGQFQKISIPNHGLLPCFNPPLPSEIPKCVTPPPHPMPCPQNSIIVNPPPLQNFHFFWKYIFDLATPI